MHFEYKENISIDLEAAKKIVQERVSMQEGVSYPILADLKANYNSTKEGRAYLAKEGSELVTAVAVLVSSPVTKVGMNFYIAIDNPSTPTKVFTDKEKALEYLQTFL